VKVYHPLIFVIVEERLVDKSARQFTSNIEKRLTKLEKISRELIDSLAKRKVDGKTVNVADIYFVLSRALQQVSFMNVIEIEEYKQKRTSQQKMVV
jgi:hypothetical protein